MGGSSLTSLDYAVVGSYFVVLLLIGLYYRRFAGRSLDDFFLAGRRNSGWANGVSYAAALMNADVAPAYSGLTVATGIFICWWYLTRFGPALFIGALLFAVFWRRLRLFTTPEFYELRFGGLASNVMRTWVAVRSSLIAMVAWTGTGLLAMHKIAGPVLGLDKTRTLMVTIPIILVYAGLAGFSGVVATAGVQSLIMLVGSAMLCGIVLIQVGGPAMLSEKLMAVAGSQVLDGFPPADHAVFPAAAAMVYLIGSSIGYGGDTAPLGGAMEGQYLLSSRNSREASKMYIVAEVTLFVLLLLVTLPSLGAIVEWPGLRSGELDRETAYGLLMTRYLPPGMLGLLFVVMLAAVMSTIGSNLTFGAQVLVNDVYRRHCLPVASEGHYLWVGRLCMLLILTLALLVVYNVSLIFDVAIFMLAFSAAELPANWAQWWWWRFNRWGRLAASFGAPLILVAVKWRLPDWSWWDQTYLVIAINTALWVLVTLLTPPDSPETLERFWRAARPLGAWKRVRDRLGQNGTETGGDTADGQHALAGFVVIAAGMAIALLGAGAATLMVLGLSHLYVGAWPRAALELVGCLVSGGMFFFTYGPFLDRLDRHAPGEPAESGPDAVTAVTAGGETSSREPVPTYLVISLAILGYGVVIIFGGMLCTRGRDLVFNLVAGLSFLVLGGVMTLLGRRRSTGRPV